MEMGVTVARDAQAEVAAADHPNLRLLMVPNRWSPEPQADMGGTWRVCSPKTVAEDGGFSAAAYYFGRELQRHLGVPVGLIDASWGGTCIETWTPPEGFAAVPVLKAEYARVLLDHPLAAAPRQPPEPSPKAQVQWDSAGVEKATALYNAMIHPLRPFALRGAIWYQGEYNSGEGMLYCERMKALVTGWRTVWGVQDANAIANGSAFPFYFVQIAPYSYGHDRPECLA